MKLVVKSIVAESQERRAVRNFCCSSKQKKEGERTKVEVKERKRMRRREKNVTDTSRLCHHQATLKFSHFSVLLVTQDTGLWTRNLKIWASGEKVFTNFKISQTLRVFYS